MRQDREGIIKYLLNPRPKERYMVTCNDKIVPLNRDFYSKGWIKKGLCSALGHYVTFVAGESISERRLRVLKLTDDLLERGILRIINIDDFLIN